MRRKLLCFGITLALVFAGLPILATPVQAATPTTVYVWELQPSWTAAGGGGVWSSYAGPPAYVMVSPGTTAVYDGREAGIIKAGLTPEPDGSYWDDGLFAFKVNVNVSSFASQALSYDVQNQTGPNPVWVRIRLVGGTQYQFVPTTNPAGWHTVNAAAGQWQLMDVDGNGTGSLMTLNEFAEANPGATVDRVYLTLGMGNSYNVSPGVGTVAWVDNVTLGEVTYDFVIQIPNFAGPQSLKQTLKQSVLIDLTALRATVTDKQDGNKLDEAIKHLTKSLTPAWWDGDAHLQVKEGEKAFNEEKDAVNQLRNLIKDKKSTIPDATLATLQDFVNRIVAADRLLAEVAIADAAGGDQKDIDKANDELVKGDSETAKGKYDSAIEHYRNAWKFAQNAIK